MAKTKAKKKVVHEDEDKIELFTFESVGDTCSGTFDREEDDGFVLVDEDETEFKVEKSPGIVQALDTPVNGKPLKETDFVIEIEFLGTRADGYKRFKVSADVI